MDTTAAGGGEPPKLRPAGDPKIATDKFAVIVIGKTRDHRAIVNWSPAAAPRNDEALAGRSLPGFAAVGLKFYVCLMIHSPGEMGPDVAGRRAWDSPRGCQRKLDQPPNLRQRNRACCRIAHVAATCMGGRSLGGGLSVRGCFDRSCGDRFLWYRWPLPAGAFPGALVLAERGLAAVTLLGPP